MDLRKKLKIKEKLLQKRSINKGENKLNEGVENRNDDIFKL